MDAMFMILPFFFMIGFYVLMVYIYYRIMKRAVREGTIEAHYQIEQRRAMGGYGQPGGYNGGSGYPGGSVNPGGSDINANPGVPNGGVANNPQPVTPPGPGDKPE